MPKWVGDGAPLARVSHGQMFGLLLSTSLFLKGAPKSPAAFEKVDETFQFRHGQSSFFPRIDLVCHVTFTFQRGRIGFLLRKTLGGRDLLHRRWRRREKTGENFIVCVSV